MYIKYDKYENKKMRCCIADFKIFITQTYTICIILKPVDAYTYFSQSLIE